MQRTFFALVASLSFLTASLGAALAQRNDGPPAEPSETPQRIDRPTPTIPMPAGAPRHKDNEETTSAPAPGGVLRYEDTEAAKPENESRPQEQDPLLVRKGETVETVFVKDRPLVLEGTVKHDVIAIDSPVTVERSAKVGGNLAVVGGSVDNKAGDAVHVRILEPEVLTSANAFTLRPETRRAAPSQSERGSNVGSAIALMLLGLVCGLVLLFVAPRSTQQTAALIALEPARCLIIGALGALAGLVVLTVNAGLTKALGLFYAPFSLIVAIVPAVILVTGWLCSMRYAGDILTRRMGKNDRGSLYPRMALGLVAFCMAQVILGGLHPWLGGIVLLIQFGLSLMGLGAILISGFGRDPDWLGARMRGEARWFGRRR